MRTFTVREFDEVSPVFSELCKFLGEETDKIDRIFSLAGLALNRWNGRFRFHVHEWLTDNDGEKFPPPENPPQLNTAIEALTKFGLEEEIQKIVDFYNSSFVNVAHAYFYAVDLWNELAPKTEEN